VSVVDDRASARVAVAPARIVESHARLLEALSRAFPVEFVPASLDGHSGCDAMICLEETAAPTCGVPTLLVTESSKNGGAAEKSVRFRHNPAGARALRGRALVEAALPASRLPAVDRGCTVLATAEDEPVWACDPERRLHVTSIRPLELEPEETLRGQFRPGRFMSLLPILEFLRDVVDEEAWELPPQRACFVFDDPNLHTSRYGYIRFKDLSRHASEVGYHAAMAMVPLDAWYAAPSAARIFRDNPTTLSLTVHGIDHLARELDRGNSPDDLRHRLAQALRRIDRFERRYGISVSRVMIAPHGTCSTVTLDQLLALGFDGASLEWPYWWLDATEDVLAGWEPADFSVSALPVMPRHHVAGLPDELVLRAYLRQPLIVYGHHGDLADGLEPLERTASLINELDQTEWSELRRIAEATYRIRRIDDDCAVLQSFSARARVRVPAGLTRFVLQPPMACNGTRPFRWFVDDGTHCVLVGPGEEVSVRSGATLSIRLASHGALDYRTLSARRPRAWSISRRALVEGRDRLVPRIDSITVRR
jgi:hypothetical protein